jgi:hypothetical protein
MIRPPWKPRAKRWPPVSALKADKVIVHEHVAISSWFDDRKRNAVFSCDCGAIGTVPVAIFEARPLRKTDITWLV